VAYNFTSLRAIDIGTLPGFMLGIVAADWRAVTHRLTRFALPAVFVAFCFALLLEPFSSVPSRFGLADLAGYWAQTNIGWQLAAFAFVVAAGHVAWLRKLLELPILCGIGAAAYGIYLVHQPIVSAWGESAGKHLDPLSNIAGSVFLALAGGLLFSYIAERPFLAERTRNRLLLGLKKPIGRGFALAGIPAGIELASGLGLTSRPLSPSVDVLQKPFEMEVHGPLA
jgi:peptidoglycan/LPS O-acetylase OafA/YrhL